MDKKSGPPCRNSLAGSDFDPARSRERFRVAMTDHASMVLMPPLMERVRAAASGITVHASAWGDCVYEEIAAGEIDTVLSAETAPPALEAEMLYEEEFVCLIGPAQRIRTRRFTLKQYLDLPLAVIDTREGQQTPVDRCLTELGLKRRAGLHVPFFVPTILTIARTDLIFTLPRKLAKIIARIADVRVVEPPHEIKGFSYFMAWHRRLTAEPAHVWFREQLRGAARTI